MAAALWVYFLIPIKRGYPEWTSCYWRPFPHH